MTVGRPGPGIESVRWVRERLLGLGLSEDHLVLSPSRLASRLGEADLEAANYLPEFGPLVQRLQRLLGGGRALSIFITGNRGEEQARAHAALQIALGILPSGRQVAIIDADFLRPGLGGLVADSGAEGVIDLVRFGRSTRSLLLRPVPQGPWLLPAGSFPVDDPVPLSPDSLRSVVYRVSQVCDLALYVGPLPIRSELHPLARVCDHVVYVMQDDSADAAAGLLDSVDQLQQQNAHLAGVVLYTVPEPARFAEPKPAPPAALPPPPPVPEAPFALPPLFTPLPERPAAASDPAPVLPAFEPPAPAPAPPGWSENERTPPEIDWNRIGMPADEFAAPAPEAATARPGSPLELPAGDWAAEHAGAPLELPRLELPRGAASQRADFDAEADAEQSDWVERSRRDLAESVARRRPRDEARDVGRDLDLRSGDFAFEQEGRGSRWPLVLVSLIVVLAIGFVSWTLWGRRVSSPPPESPTVAERNPPPAETTQPTTPPGSAPSTVTKPPAPTANPPATEPDDRAAAQTNAGTRPTTTPPVDGGATTAPRTEPVPPPRPEPVRNEPPVTQRTEPPATQTPATRPEPVPSTTPPAPPMPQPETHPAPAGDVVFSVHVASYKTLPQAQKEIDQLRKYGYESRAIQTDLGSKGVWFRVYVGSCNSSAEANVLRDKLLQLPGYDFAQVRRLPRE